MNIKTVPWLFLAVCLCGAFCRADADENSSQNTYQNISYGNATVDKIISIEGIYSFQCDVNDWPAIIGKNITVRIDKIAEPEIVEKNPKPNRFFEEQCEKFIHKILLENRPASIRLENIKRGRLFFIIADVIVDDNSLAEMLVKEELAGNCSDQQLMQILQRQEKPFGSAQDKQPTDSTASAADKNNGQQNTETQSPEGYVASKNSGVFHRSTCSHAKRIAPENIVRFESTQQALQTGRKPCKTCKP